ncbi:TniQ family protein [Burkholderia ambifaria]
MFRISPFDAGTGRVECLSSFAIRYAESMAVSFIDFYRCFIFPVLPHESTNVTRVTIPSGTVIDGITKTALDWTRALEKVTSVKDLSACTLLPFAGVVAARRLVTASRRWCPLCLEEMAGRERGAVFEPLVWKLEEVKFCSRHKLPLVSKCPKCQKGGSILSLPMRV